MLHNIFSHWKTTLAGILVAIGSVTVNGMSVKQFAIAAAIAALGAIAKDPGSVEGVKP